MTFFVSSLIHTSATSWWRRVCHEKLTVCLAVNKFVTLGCFVRFAQWHSTDTDIQTDQPSSYLQTLHFNILTSISPICSCT